MELFFVPAVVLAFAVLSCLIYDTIFTSKLYVDSDIESV